MDADHFEPLSVYDAWPRGELDFTPWLAENMDLLSQAVGIHLDSCRKRPCCLPEEAALMFWLELRVKSDMS